MAITRENTRADMAVILASLVPAQPVSVGGEVAMTAHHAVVQLADYCSAQYCLYISRETLALLEGVDKDEEVIKTLVRDGHWLHACQLLDGRLPGTVECKKTLLQLQLEHTASKRWSTQTPSAAPVEEWIPKEGEPWHCPQWTWVKWSNGTHYPLKGYASLCVKYLCEQKDAGIPSVNGQILKEAINYDGNIRDLFMPKKKNRPKKLSGAKRLYVDGIIYQPETAEWGLKGKMPGHVMKPPPIE